MSLRNLTHGSLLVQDGTSPTPNERVISIQNGDLEFTRKQAANVVMHRGTLAEFTRGSEEPCSIRFSFSFDRWEGKPAGTPSIKEALTGTGLASGVWKTVSANKLNSPFTTNLVFTLQDVEGVAAGGFNETLTFAEFHADEISFKEGEDTNTCSVSGKALILEPTVDADASTT